MSVRSVRAVLKGNDNHDELGRFASDDSAASSRTEAAAEAKRVADIAVRHAESKAAVARMAAMRAKDATGKTRDALRRIAAERALDASSAKRAASEAIRLAARAAKEASVP